MSSVIQIKRSSANTIPTALFLGELAYSWAPGADKLYIGTGSDLGSGIADTISVIGGRYFVDKLDHQPGVLVANSAIIVDDAGKIDTVRTDSISIGNTGIISMYVGADIILDTSGNINVSNSKIINVAYPSANTDAATKQYVEDRFLSAEFKITGDNGLTDNVYNGQVVTFVGGTGISTVIENNYVTFNLDNTTVTSGVYGSSSQVPVISVDSQGRITNVSLAEFTIPSSSTIIVSDNGNGVFSDSLIITGASGVSTTASDNSIILSLDDSGVISGNYGSPSTTVALSIDSQGRITDATASNISISSSYVNDFAESVQDVVGGMLLGGSQGGISVTYNDNGIGGGYLNFNVNDPTITLSGDVVGSATMTNLGDITITTTIQPDSVALGTDTTGNYVASLIAGTGVSITNAISEGSSPTISIGQNVSPTANVTFAGGTYTGSVHIDGDLFVAGNTVSISTTNLSVDDNLIYLNANSTIANPDLGWAGGYNDGTYAHAGFFRDATDGFFKPFYGYTPEPDETAYINTSHVSFALADIQAANFRGALIGNAETSTKWISPITINITGDVTGSTSIDGSSNVSITAVIQPNSVTLGTDTTGNYAGSVAVSGSGISVIGSAGEGTNYTIQSSATSLNSADTIVYRDGSRNFSANTITATLIGNASTASTLKTGRTIAISGDITGSTVFDGSGNVDIVTTMSPIVLGTNTTGNYVAEVASGSGIYITGSGTESATVTVAAVDANTSTKGVASFNSSNFTVTSGAVSLSYIDGGSY